MYGIRNILIPTVMSEFIIVVFQVVQVKYKQQKICQFFAPAGIFVVSIPVVAAGQEILFRKFAVESRAAVSISFRDTNAVSQARVTINSSMAMRPAGPMSCAP